MPWSVDLPPPVDQTFGNTTRSQELVDDGIFLAHVIAVPMCIVMIIAKFKIPPQALYFFCDFNRAIGPLHFEDRGRLDTFIASAGRRSSVVTMLVFVCCGPSRIFHFKIPSHGLDDCRQGIRCNTRYHYHQHSHDAHGF